LTQSSSEISAGRLNETIDVHSSDEIGILAGGFAVMRDSIKNQIVVLETENEERKKAEAALKQSEEKYRTLVENSPLGIAVIDKQHNYIYLSSNFIKIFGYTLDDFSTGKEWFKLAFPDKDNREQVIERWIDDKNIAKSGDSRPRTFDVVCKDGNVKTIDFKPTTLETGEQIVMYEDITERKQSEELLIQTEKMMSVGGLAAGMAHELNNPLGGMLQGTQNIRRRLSPDLEKNVQSATTHGINLNNLQNYLKERKILDYLVGINESGQRAAKIIKDMLLFSRKSESTMAPTNLLEIMENVLDLAGKNYDLKKKYDFRSIDIIREFEPNLPLISCTATEIEQVVLNLLSNAAWAMANEKRNTPPQITLRVKIEKQMARIDIEDNGPGIDEDIKKRIFEPFFTTKPLGEGTGLGLSVSYMIITNNHRGTMEVESEIGKGTNFIIKLPLDKIGS
ncbi:MAG: PAS domain S-box protein, partial [Deltaproteobacteria bacterium]|nr:PAS domain S-box protein [Deltaproteobacteria bacterium]